MSYESLLNNTKLKETLDLTSINLSFFLISYSYEHYTYYWIKIIENTFNEYFYTCKFLFQKIDTARVVIPMQNPVKK